ncbi:MAG: hypothetical protein AAB612_00480 [Patescibacteria group bacterium]
MSANCVGIRVANGPKLPGLERESVELHTLDEIDTVLSKIIEDWFAKAGDTALDLQSYLMYKGGSEVRILHKSDPKNVEDLKGVLRSLFVSAGVEMSAPTEQKGLE